MVPNSDPCRAGPNDIASKSKGKTVHYDPVITDDHPAPPAEVLTRTREAAEHTSAGAAQWSEDVEHVPWGDVVMRDRAYIKFSYSETDSLPSDFDEWQNRTTGHLYNEDWAEYIVVWRKNRLELYTGHARKDWVLGHMKLVFVIPLGQSTTRLSLYSFVDLTFCIVCPPAPLRHRSKRRWLNRRHKGLNIFVFKIRSRTRAIDWVWKLWRHLGGELPTSLDIRSPLLDTRVRIDMPRFEGIELTAAYRIFENKNVLRLCRENLSKTGNEHELLRHKLATGAKLALAWRSETNLDWVSQLDDVQGNPRKWAILCGLALNQHGKGAHLEVRLKEHFPTRLHLKDGTVLDEPPAVEGYLERIRPNSQLKQSVYLTIHNNYIFAVPIAHAHHPRPPGFLTPGTDADSLRESEVQRGAQQILHATGMTDLRNIIAVRRAFHIAQDKGSLHMRRSFELLLTTGNVVRFEAFSCQVALEWIVRLRPLISYWRRRHQADAQTEMQLAYISTGRARITPLRHASLPELSSFFNWCALEGCRSIVRSGKLFARKGLWGQYKHVQVVLIAGNLVQFRITGRKSLHHHRHTGINLQDAYLVSGYLAAQYLPEGQYDPDAPHLARRYQDGLETDDGPEDTLFMMWYRTQVDPSSNMSKVVAGDTPRLEVKRQLSFFKTRSKLERDAWVWAINMEIEKAVRSTKDREERIREAGNIVKT
ncbi:hypothetical protein IEO21_07826 [Rhodonia placenta]|uniref:Mug56/Spo71 PH domain-containing protein n=1 Tax=Rhodonia placenta TaxID=104341 RepID=A0A8H7NXC4_9APHY|nr:hypothetical protein IEO21_07826 [Postia placenta]